MNVTPLLAKYNGTSNGTGAPKPADPVPQKKGRKKRNGRNFVNADLEWVYLMNDQHGTSAALVYAVLGTHANMQRQHKKGVCVVPCDLWKTAGFDETTWRRALKHLIEAGAIDYEKLDRSTLRIFVSDNPADPAFGALENLDQGNLQNDG